MTGPSRLDNNVRMERVQIAALIVSGASRRSTKAPNGADPLDPIAGLSLLTWVIDAAVGASVRRIAVVADPADARTRDELESRSDQALVEFVPRRNDLIDDMGLAIDRLGSDLTLRENTHLLVLPAEAPQIQAGELRLLIDEHLRNEAAATILGDPSAESALSDEPLVERDSSGQIHAILDPLNDGVGPAATVI